MRQLIRVLRDYRVTRVLWRWHERDYRRRDNKGAWTEATTTHYLADGGFILHLWAIKVQWDRRSWRE